MRGHGSEDRARARALAAALWALTAGSCTSRAHLDVQGPAASCPDVQSIRVSAEPESDVLDDHDPESADLTVVQAGASTNAIASAVAVGPVLGSMDLRNVETARACDANGVRITATTTRSAAYEGAVQKNVLWRPRLEIVFAPHSAVTVLTTIWKMRLTTGAEVSRARTPPYPEQNYPVTVTARIPGP